MLRKAVFQIVLAIALIGSVVVILRNWTYFLPISDEAIETQIMSVSRVFTAQYTEIKKYFPQDAEAIREEAKRLERMHRRGIHIPPGALWSQSRDIMAPKYRLARHAPEDTLDASLARLLAGYEMFRGHPQCGNFLLDGTSAISREERGRYYTVLAKDTPVHFAAVVAGSKATQERRRATGEDWSRLFSLHVASGHPESDVDAVVSAYREGTRKTDIDMPRYCNAYLDVIGSLVGARFVGSAEIKAGLVISGFGVSE